MDNPSRSTLAKILVLEKQLGYKDTAVMGGLDKFVSRWKDSFTGLHPDYVTAAGLGRQMEQDSEVARTLEYYRQSSMEERKEKIENALRLLQGEAAITKPSLSVKEPASPKYSDPLTYTTPTRTAEDWDDLRSASQPSTDWTWGIVVGIAIVLIWGANYLLGLSIVGLLKVVLAAGLIYFIKHESNAPYLSKRGQKVWLYHGPLVSARWKEKSDRKVTLFWLWVMLLGVLASFLQQ